MGARLKVYAAPGKSVATARGIVDQAHEQPEITPRCLVRGEATADQLAAAKESIKHLLELGVLVKLDAAPSVGETNPAAASADVDMRGEHAQAPAGTPPTRAGKGGAKGGATRAGS